MDVRNAAIDSTAQQPNSSEVLLDAYSHEATDPSKLCAEKLGPAVAEQTAKSLSPLASPLTPQYAEAPAVLLDSEWLRDSTQVLPPDIQPRRASSSSGPRPGVSPKQQNLLGESSFPNPFRDLHKLDKFADVWEEHYKWDDGGTISRWDDWNRQRRSTGRAFSNTGRTNPHHLPRRSEPIRITRRSFSDGEVSDEAGNAVSQNSSNNDFREDLSGTSANLKTKSSSDEESDEALPPKSPVGALRKGSWGHKGSRKRSSVDFADDCDDIEVSMTITRTVSLNNTRRNSRNHNLQHSSSLSGRGSFKTEGQLDDFPEVQASFQSCEPKIRPQQQPSGVLDVPLPVFVEVSGAESRTGSGEHTGEGSKKGSATAELVSLRRSASIPTKESTETDPHGTGFQLFRAASFSNMFKRAGSFGVFSHAEPSAPRGNPIHSSSSLDPSQVGAKNPIDRKQLVKARWAKATWYSRQEVIRERQKKPKGTSSDTFSRPHSHHSHASNHSWVSVLSSEDSVDNPDATSRTHHCITTRISALVGSRVFRATMIAVSCLALFNNDVVFLAQEDPSYDNILFISNTLILLLFVIELVLKSLVTIGYKWSVFFWLDLLATISLIPDATYLLGSVNLVEALQEMTVLRTSRSALVAARIARIARVARLTLRLIGEHENKESDGDNAGPLNDDTKHLGHFGKDLEQKAIKAVVCAVAGMLVLGILLSILFEPNKEDLLKKDLGVISKQYVRALDTGSNFSFILDTFVEAAEEHNHQYLYLKVCGVHLYGSMVRVDRFRSYPSEVITLEMDPFKGCQGASLLHIDDRQGAKDQYVGNLISVCSVLVILAVACVSIAVALNQSASIPVRRMTALIIKFARDPMMPMEKPKGPAYRELAIVQNALVKFANLLQIAYGAAGAQLISSTLASHSDRHQGPGRIVHAFFGFCDIRNFTDLTEVLQAEVVKVVNGVAHFVHRSVADHSGFANKNIGDAFLLAWKPQDGSDAQHTAEAALRSFIRIVIDVEESRQLRKWASHHAIQSRLPGFKVKMGFGLHFGWAVEGAIGSALKIDASYLSPHVNLASRLESATKQYGVDILVSGDVVGLLPREIMNLCRLVDRVTVKGSKKPLLLYTYDVPSVADADGCIYSDSDVDATRSTKTSFSNAEFFATFKPRTSVAFREMFRLAILNYLGGENGESADWKKAKSLLNDCLEMEPNDGPSTTILKHITSHSSDGWQGFRSLDEK